MIIFCRFMSTICDLCGDALEISFKEESNELFFFWPWGDDIEAMVSLGIDTSDAMEYCNTLPTVLVLLLLFIDIESRIAVPSLPCSVLIEIV